MTQNTCVRVERSLAWCKRILAYPLQLRMAQETPSTPFSCKVDWLFVKKKSTTLLIGNVTGQLQTVFFLKMSLAIWKRRRYPRWILSKSGRVNNCSENISNKKSTSSLPVSPNGKIKQYCYLVHRKSTVSLTGGDRMRRGLLLSTGGKAGETPPSRGHSMHHANVTLKEPLQFLR